MVLEMEAWNVRMYSPSVVNASKSVLVEVLRCLGSYGRYLVLVGGWAPYFILEKFGGGKHCGSVGRSLTRVQEFKVFFQTFLVRIKIGKWE